MPDNDAPPSSESPLERLRRLAAEAQAARAKAADPTPDPSPFQAPPPPEVTVATSPRRPPPGLARPIEQTGPAELVPTQDAEPRPLEPIGPADAVFRRTSRGLAFLTGALTLLVLLAAVGLLLANRESGLKDTAAAKAAAAQMMIDIETVDYNKIQDWLPRVQRDSTGAQLASFDNDSDLFSQATKSNKLVSLGHVVTSAFCGGQCASAQVTGDTATALVFTNAKVVTSVSSPAGGVSLDRWSLKLTKVKGQWLTVEVDQVPVAPAA